jgi:phosphoesterase RecJ-like protein
VTQAAQVTDLGRAAALLREPGGPVVVACHVNPDGDALGAALAISLGLEAMGTPAPLTFGTSDIGTSVPRNLGFLPLAGHLHDPAELIAGPPPAVLITTDTGSVDRLGPAAALVARAEHVLVVDHHASNTLFGTEHLIDVTAASTTVLAGQLLDELGVTWTRDIATCLYAGLVTDSGSFRFQATTPDVHRLAARLLECGVDHVGIGRALFDTTPYTAVTLLGQVMADARLEGNLVWSCVTAAQREEAGLSLADVEGAIDLIRTASESEVAAVLKGVTDTEWAVSLRSRGTVDVGAVAVSLGGGGHPYAAGYTTHGGVEAVIDGLRKALAT